MIIQALSLSLSAVFAAGTPELPQPTAGQDVIGTKLPLDDLAWVNTSDSEPPKLEGKVTLVRWWTETCPYCAGSLPVIKDLEERFADRGFQTVAVYHPKPPRPLTDKHVLASAERFGYAGPIARDNEWSVLREAYLDGGRRPATSVSFLLDEEGAIRYIHPGPSLRPAEKPGENKIQAEYDRMLRAINALLAEIDTSESQ